jgi:hypothetical protein
VYDPPINIPTNEANDEDDNIAAIEEDNELKFCQGSVMYDHIASAIWDDYQFISLE